MAERKKKKMVRLVALILALAMLVMTGFYIFAMTGWFGSSIGASGFFVSAASQEAAIQEKVENLEDLIVDIQDLYKDEIDINQVFDGIYEGLFDALGDPWSVYYPSSETSSKLIKSIEGEYSGVGITMTAANGRVIVTAVAKASPAELAGLQIGDYIMQIDGQTIEGLEIEDVALLIRGEEGTSVTLTVEKGGLLKNFTMVRQTIKIESVSYKMLEDQIGYIAISSFDSNTDDEFFQARLVLLNQGMKGLVIDVRNNGGGLMHSALSVANQLIPTEGILAYYEKQGKIIESVESTVNSLRTVPIVVLTNQGTASASECLVGALQDRGAATIVGETTYGKGVAQIVSEIADGAAIKLSVFYFLTPDKDRIDGNGIVPDIVVHKSGGLSSEEISKITDTLVPMTEPVRYYAGDIGLNVYAAQQRLQYMGYDVELTAVMDEQMLNAVKKFQAENNLYPYGALDFTTTKAVASAFHSYVNPSDEDLQLEKALDILSN